MEPKIDKKFRNTVTALYQKLKHNSIVMLQDRGFGISQNERNILTMSTQEFLDYYGPSISVSLFDKLYTDTKGNTVYVKFVEIDGQIGIELMRNTINEMYNKKINHLILVSKTKLTSDSRKWINELPSLRIDIFLFGEMIKNPTNHFLVPKHQKASEQEVNSLNQQLSDKRIPQISVEDPICKWYGWLPGTIVRIDRLNLSLPMMVNQSVSFRKVRNVPLETKTIDISKVKRK